MIRRSPGSVFDDRGSVVADRRSVREDRGSVVADDRGSVVAEFAVALPAVILVIAMGVAALGASARALRLQDAVADAARLAGRGETAERVRAVVADAVPGASSSIEERGDLVCVIASAPVGPPFTLALAATSCALDGGL